MKNIAILIILLASVSLSTHAATYVVDQDHTAITFKVRHLVGKVSGRFERFSGEFTYDGEKPSRWKTSATIDAASINTSTAKRDEHLRSSDFFDVKKFPTLTFTSKRIRDLENNRAKMDGSLTIHGVTRPVTFDLEIGGTSSDPFGGPDKAAFTATTTINRHDFGLLPSPLIRLHSGRSILRRHEAEFSGRIGNTDRKFGEGVARK